MMKSCCAGFAFAVAFASLGWSGELDPTGTLGPTMRTLDEIEARTPISGPLPVVIDSPGSYYLTTNLTGASGEAGLVLAADDVTIDLNGFALIGARESLDGVSVLPTALGLSRISLRNGTACGWGDDGIDLEEATGCRIQDVTSASNADCGIVTGDRARVVACTVSDCSGFGISCGESALVQECQTSSTAVGVNAGSGSIIQDCRVSDITEWGTWGVAVASGSRVEGCTAVYCRGSSGGGIYAFEDSLVSGCTVLSCMNVGIESWGATVTGCTVSRTGVGIGASGGGFWRIAGSRIIGNSCDLNGTGIQIQIGSKGGILDGNTLLGSRRGIHTAYGAGNLIVRNRVSGSQTESYLFSPMDSHGPIVDSTAGGSLASAEAAAHPWANFIF